MKLNEKGQCCGRKPLVYKRQGIKFCPSCDRDFDINTGEQRPNFAWVKSDAGEFVRRWKGE